MESRFTTTPVITASKQGIFARIQYNINLTVTAIIGTLYS